MRFCDLRFWSHCNLGTLEQVGDENMSICMCVHAPVLSWVLHALDTGDIIHGAGLGPTLLSKLGN